MNHIRNVVLVFLASCAAVPAFAQDPDAAQWITPGCADWSLAPETRGLSCKEAVQRYKDHLKATRSQRAAQGQQACIDQGMLYSTVASMRDAGMSPQQVFGTQAVHAGINRGSFTEAWAKQAINRVYFDPGFVNAGGPALRNQMMDLCMNPQGKFQPLK